MLLTQDRFKILIVPVLSIFCTYALTSLAHAESAADKARLGRTLWSAFQCASYAELSGDKEEQERLFIVGVRAGRDFLRALEAKEIPAEVARSEVPIGVTMLLQGPSYDFVIGRIFENATDDAYDSIVKENNGIPLDPSRWVRDDEIRKLKAQNEYLRGNCALVK